MNFFVKALLKKQLKHLPDDQVDMLIRIIEKNPDFFKQIADEIQVKVGQGMDQQTAAMDVLKSHESEVKKLLADESK